MPNWNPPRKGRAGETGTFEILFKNGSKVVLNKVSLEWQHIPSKKKRPAFRAHFLQANERVAWTSSGTDSLDPESIEAIFRLDEDLNS